MNRAKIFALFCIYTPSLFEIFPNCFAQKIKLNEYLCPNSNTTD